MLQATLDQPAYLKRLGVVWLLFFLLLGGPIAAQTFDPMGEVHNCPLSAVLVLYTHACTLAGSMC